MWINKTTSGKYYNLDLPVDFLWWRDFSNGKFFRGVTQPTQIKHLSTFALWFEPHARSSTSRVYHQFRCSISRTLRTHFLYWFYFNFNFILERGNKHTLLDLTQTCNFEFLMIFNTRMRDKMFALFRQKSSICDVVRFFFFT